eukprot:CAMPEP_0170451598 /NCGR_PEP_ID=MMETSP0123-20130129/783_1 /TAXON_ID=182087 /ORGANISM="Favella ehrenbergii, Strain Fehren 1" /LENGTH=46 /DNA_ID= /DNA_START= /DNA_END= /DNA_ORIENTATION=
MHLGCFDRVINVDAFPDFACEAVSEAANESNKEGGPGLAAIADSRD